MQKATGGCVVVQVDDWALAGDIVQEMAAFFGVANLSVVADFPEQLQALESLLARMVRGAGRSWAAAQGLVRF